MKDLDKFKSILLRERVRVESQIRASTAEGAQTGLELADYDNHPADSASETYERTKSFAIEENFKEILERIDGALRKIDDGTYGRCDRCGEMIKLERLRAIPYATFCISCQEKLERR